MAMPRDHHALSFEGAIDQLRQLILGLGNAMGAHKSNIAIDSHFVQLNETVLRGLRSAPIGLPVATSWASVTSCAIIPAPIGQPTTRPRSWRGRFRSWRAVPITLCVI